MDSYCGIGQTDLRNTPVEIGVLSAAMQRFCQPADRHVHAQSAEKFRLSVNFDFTGISKISRRGRNGT